MNKKLECEVDAEGVADMMENGEEGDSWRSVEGQRGQ